jgi:hypothetical protein
MAGRVSGFVHRAIDSENGMKELDDRDTGTKHFLPHHDL